uniref:RWD domain-containing protein n=1 Tax=Clastoptera arizonana TaxID=38151 RepID=A0A1B6CUG0_9HEMI
MNMHDDERVDDELEALKAILMDEILIKTDDRNKAVGIETDVFPWTALDTQQQFVRVTLEIELTPSYPDTSPIVLLRNPRGLDDSTLTSIEQQIRAKCKDYIGQPVIFELIDVVKEHLTASNVPCCQCCVCLYGFRQSDHFTKTPCYHYFHSHCLAGHLTASERIFKEEQEKLPAWQKTEKFQAVCPVCRAPLAYDLKELSSAPPPLDVEEAPNFVPSQELRHLQQQMASLFLHQQQRGGIIQEDNRLILLSDEGNATTNTR